MSEWKESTLGDELIVQRGHDLPKISMVEGQYPVCSSSGILGYHNAYTHDGDGLTIGRSGHGIGKVFYYQGPFWAHNTVLYVKDFKGNFPKFFYYFLKNLDFTTFNTGSAIPSLNRNHLYLLNIKLPVLAEQKAIASVLSSLDDKIDLLHRQNKTLEAMAETLFRQWFIEEAKEDWEECELSEFGHIICGKTPSKSNANYFGNDVPFLKIPDMHGRVFISKTTDNLSQLGALSQSKKMVPQNSICVSCIATVGLVCITDCDLQTNQQINSIVPNELKFLYYLYEVMLDMYDELHNLASGGTATLNLNTGDFSRIKIVKPDDVTLLQFNNAVIPLFTKIRFNGSQIQTLEQLRDMLLPKLMSGEVRVQYQTEEIA